MIGAASDVFTRQHIAATAACTGVLVFGVAMWRYRGAHAWIVRVLVALLAGASVYLWRASANMPQLNRDGISGYSANDWLAPVVVFAVLTVYADFFPPTDPRRFRQVRGAATVVAFAVNVITI